MGKRRIASRSIGALTAGLVLVGGLAAPSSAYVRPGVTERVTWGPAGLEPLGSKVVPFTDVSGDGRIVTFSTDDPTILPGINRALLDYNVFLFNRTTRRTELVSKTSSGLPAIGGRSERPSISNNGRFIAYQSGADNLVPGDTNDAMDVFVYDRRTGSTERIVAGVAPSSPPLVRPSISATGRYVAFESTASDLVDGDDNDASDVFLYDRKKKQTKLVSLTSEEQQADGISNSGSVSSDGRFVAFTSSAPNLRGSPVGFTSVYVRDVERGSTELVSLPSDGSEPGGIPSSGNDSNGGHTISADGRYVVFKSTANNLVPNDQHFTYQDAFVHDRLSHRTTRVNVSSFGEEGAGAVTGDEGNVSLSRDGRFVAFSSYANNLVDGDTGICPPLDLNCAVFGPVLGGSGDLDVFVNDAWTGATELISQTHGEQAEPCSTAAPASERPSISATGRYISFASCSTNLQPGDANLLYDAFIRDRGDPLGFGGQGEPGQGSSLPDKICIDDLCVPPGGATTINDGLSDVLPALTRQGANLYGASLAYRPQYQDLFAAVELDYMPRVLPVVSPILHGLRFEVGDKTYEVRATSLLGGTFGLFDCTRPACTKVSDLRGGYGTTGMRIVFSIPLDQIGLAGGGTLSDVEAFSALGSYLTGAANILDTVRIK